MNAADTEADLVGTLEQVVQQRLQQLPREIANEVAERLHASAANLSRPGLEAVASGEPLATAKHAEVEQFKLGTHRLHKEQAEVLEALEKARKEREELRAELAGLNAATCERKTAEQTATAEWDRKLEDFESALAARSSELEQRQAAVATAQAILDAADGLQAEKEEHERQKKLLQEEARSFEVKCTEFAQREQQQSEAARHLLEKLRPKWLGQPAFAEWNERIMKSAGDPGAEATFQLFFAALHFYTAALRDGELKTLHDNLRELGRRLYAWLKELEQSEFDSVRHAELWAGAINEECGGRAEVEIPIPGNAASSAWMVFQTRSGGSPDVVSVRSWCVRDGQRRPVHKAEVTV